MQENRLQLLDINELTKIALKHSHAIQWIPYEKANPGIGYVYLLCPKKKMDCQLAFLCSRYYFISQVDQKWENCISNDPKGLHRWTIRSYRIQETDGTSLIEILDDPVYLDDNDLSMFLLTVSGMLESYTKEFLSNPIRLYAILRSSVNS